MRVVGTAFMANALGHSLGFAYLTGGAIRLKGYGDSGCTAAEVGQIVFHTTTGFLLGAWALGAITAVLVPEQLAAVLWERRRCGARSGSSRSSALIALMVSLRSAPTAIQVRKVRLVLPARRDACLALVVSIAELACAAATSLLPLAIDSRHQLPELPRPLSRCDPGGTRVHGASGARGVRMGAAAPDAAGQ